MVVSDIGDRWSPHTAPERVADIPMKNIGSVTSNIDTTIGIKIPKVPQLVPVAKAKNIATTKITTGKKELKLPTAFSISPPTYWVEPSRSLDIFFKAVAIVKIKIADTIEENPSEIASIDFSNVMAFFTIKNTIVIISAIIDPMARAMDESVSVSYTHL